MPLELLFLLFALCGCVVFALYKNSKSQKLVEDRLASMLGASAKVSNRSGRLNPRKFGKPENRLAALIFAAVFLLGYLIGLHPLLAFLLAAISAPLSWKLFRRYRLRKMRERFADRFPDAVDSLTRAVQSGIPVEKALASIGDIFEGEMGERFRKLEQHLELGMPFRDAMEKFSADLQMADVDFFCGVLILNRESGSRLSPLLISLSKTLRERRAVSRKLLALTAETRASARVLMALPVVIIVLQFFLNPAQLEFLITDDAGRIVLAYCFASMAAGILIIRRMSRMSEF